MPKGRRQNRGYKNRIGEDIEVSYHPEIADELKKHGRKTGTSQMRIQYQGYEKTSQSNAAVKTTHEPSVNRKDKKDKRKRRKALNNQYMTY